MFISLFGVYSKVKYIQLWKVFIDSDARSKYDQYTKFQILIAKCVQETISEQNYKPRNIYLFKETSTFKILFLLKKT